MYKPTIGLEVHVELNTKSKMFCSCKNDADESRPNVNICPVCMGHPGTLPVINGEAVRKVIKTGLALDCEIAEHSRFDRKNYFYPDLPKGYQISQYDAPFCKEGFLKIANKKVKIKRIHLEEDTGRSVHAIESGGKIEKQEDWEAISSGPTEKMLDQYKQEDYSLVDFNRAGVPLMELVTEPDLDSGKEAKLFGQEFQLILRYLGVSEAGMEKGQMRVEVNISLSESKKLGTKVEIKNLNSFRSVEKAIDFEINRQKELLESGQRIIQETRGWHDLKEITFSQREKEKSHDYRYFPEPDLPPLSLAPELIQSIKSEIPELPKHYRERFIREYELTKEDAEFFVQRKDMGGYLEKIISEFGERIPKNDLAQLIKSAVNYLTTDLQGLLRGASIKGKEFLITPENFSEFILLIYKKKISSKTAKTVLAEMFQSGADPHHIIEDKNLNQIDSESEIEDIIKTVISENQEAVADFQKGKTNSFQYLIGKAMTKSSGKADPALAAKILKKLLTK
ncbi:MAG: glutaminyl-tRNA synthase (glutamine-hydrolyzing) subunit B [Candidatus Wildermuthbacteria bacterium RIFCSPLOWO2_12_FULL_40_9]|uniref:Aspartyl/glutamyl-tRNA(Asn/Gln) amidotransferase subunit B n=1 Tax=Candidatus Wildermuthbacteria bacterium RIFCSPLOWO2_12_FULL_40_9 TaxID=1802467 RepID=A0A1G2RWM9_9BACT|nr:MAG: glutaminyl-tRNA synthase (glutamine-hydrolyzing) subunit B [Candidatus Wildermuthbacteria bacterium RIFCSPLOWO2_12_FULL_40_9]